MKTKVVNLVGASGSGKTTIAKELEKTGCNIIQSYTTRPPRYKDEWGHTFIRNPLEIGYYNPITLIEYEKDGTTKEYTNIIAYFNSYNSGHHYFATDEQVIGGKTNIYIVDNVGAKQVHDFYKNSVVEVITIYLQVPFFERYRRLFYSRESKEALDRVLEDKRIFDVVKCDYVIDAEDSIDNIVEKVVKIIEE